jgi:hypothetical protein
MRRPIGWVATVAALVVVQGAGCQGSSSGSGIIVAATDATPPSLSLGVAVAGTQLSATLGTTGSDAAITLPAKTGTVNLIATATDDQSGVSDVQIWVQDRRVRTCDGSGSCSGGDPGLTPGLRFDAPSAPAVPGDEVAASSINIQSLDLSREIAQSSPAAGDTRTTSFVLYAVATNHLGGRSETTRVTFTFAETG